MADEEDAPAAAAGAPNDWNEVPHQLPARPPPLLQQRFNLRFAVDAGGSDGHDMYVAMLPNGVCVLGLAPSHPLLARHRHPELQPHGGQESDGAQAVTASAGADAAASADAGATAGIAPAGGAGDAGGGAAAAPVAAPNAAAGADATCASSAAAEGRHTDEPAVAAAAPGGTNPRNYGSGGQPGGAGGGKQRGYQKRRRDNGAGADDGVADAMQHLRRVDSFPMASLRGVNFEVGRNGRGRLDIKDSGKRRDGGGTHLVPKSCLCRIESSEGTCVFVPALVSGRLLEVNGRLAERGQLLFEAPLREGYLAAVFVAAAEAAALKARLLDAPAYLALRGLAADELW